MEENGDRTIQNQRQGSTLNLAETKRFELLKGFTPDLVSSEVMRVALNLVYAWMGTLQGN